MSEISESHAVIGGYRTRVLEVEGSGTPILLLHGFSDSADTWRGVLAALARAGRPGLAVDLPGFAQAQDPEGDLLTALDGFVAAAVDRLALHGWTPVVVGNSLGGSLAMRAVSNPAVQVAGVMPIAPPAHGHPRLLEGLVRFRALEPMLFRPIVPMPLYRLLAAKVFAWLASSKEPLAAGYAMSWSAQFRTARDVRRVLGVIPYLREKLLEAEGPEGGPTAPIHALWGSGDRICLVSGVPTFQRAYQAASIEVLDGLGHCPQLQDPAKVADRILSFVDGLEGYERRTRSS